MKLITKTEKSVLIFFILILSIVIRTELHAQVICSTNDRLFFEHLSQIKAENETDYWNKITNEFLGKPYVSNTLEVGINENVIVNLQELDCTTFIEYVLAMHLTWKDSNDLKPTFESFTNNIERIRYRDGIRTGYPSRLHYYSDWLTNNEKKGILKTVFSSAFQEKALQMNFMSTHRGAYKHLKGEENFKEIQRIESVLSPIIYELPKASVKYSEDILRHGDIVGLVTKIKGLDMSHTGFVYKIDGVSHLLHASSKNQKIEISEVTLHEYLKRLKTTTGIVVYRFLSKSAQ